MSELPVLNSMWVEGPLSYVERVCLKSALACGHKVVLYTYFDVTGVPDGVEVRDGREVMGEDYLMKDINRQSWALCADIFRYKLMKQALGIWIDADVYMTKPIEEGFHEYLFGWQKDNLINNAVIYFRSDGELVDKLIGLIDAPFAVPPWLPRRKKLRYQIRPWLGLRPLTLAEHRWGVIGPRALTHFAKELDLTRHAVPQDVFYPVPPKQARLLFDPEADIEQYMTERTIAVHLWNEGIKELKREPAPKGSFIERICTAHDVPMT